MPARQNRVRCCRRVPRFPAIFATIEAHTARFYGFKGKKSGELLQAAETAGYEVRLTVDQGIPQQMPGGRGALPKLSFVAGRAKSMHDHPPR